MSFHFLLKSNKFSQFVVAIRVCRVSNTELHRCKINKLKPSVTDAYLMFTVKSFGLYVLRTKLGIGKKITFQKRFRNQQCFIAFRNKTQIKKQKSFEFINKTYYDHFTVLKKIGKFYGILQKKNHGNTNEKLKYK